jgi:rare lipoprotein A (peptidoglycan hydrolase)
MIESSSVFRGAIAVMIVGMLAACSTNSSQSGKSQSEFGLTKSSGAVESHGAQSSSGEAQSSAEELGAVGMASWYGGSYHGRQTASGEIFDENGLTAAHRSLPFGTQVKVTNLANGRSLTLRINDRGPFVGGRIIDVSRKAAEQLGFKKEGLARVRVEVMG